MFRRSVFSWFVLGAIACGSRGDSSGRNADPPGASSILATARDSLSCPTHVPQFADYRVDTVFRGRPAVVDFSSQPDLRLFRTVLREGATRGPNFAGRLTVVQWGCGSPCQVQQLIDAPTGRLLGSVGTELGAEYHVDSRLLVANPMDSTKCYNVECSYCGPIYYLWNGKSLDSIW